VARELKQRSGNVRVTLLEKEADCGEHASGRNSGVIHAGFYYSANSLKAKLTSSPTAQRPKRALTLSGLPKRAQQLSVATIAAR
jgi:L-2-hydroxyglutarate oxidase LhgO